MKVVLRKSLKGTQVWIAGTVFDSSESPIPPEVMHEVRAGSSLVEVLPQVGLAPPTIVEPPVPHVEIHRTPDTLPEPEMPPPLEVEKEPYHYAAKKEKHKEVEEGSAEKGPKESEKVVRHLTRK